MTNPGGHKKLRAIAPSHDVLRSLEGNPNTFSKGVNMKATALPVTPKLTPPTKSKTSVRKSQDSSGLGLRFKLKSPMTRSPAPKKMAATVM
jgi:hypothetical protein